MNICTNINNKKSRFFTKIQDKKVWAVFIAFVFSAGFFNILYFFISFIINTFDIPKKIVYLSDYFDGIWIGFFVGKSGEIRLFYEEYSQSVDKLRIKGTSFNQDGTMHATWLAEDPLLKTEEEKIIYYYETDAINNTFINPGFASFNIYYSKFKIPKRLCGFSSDLYNSKKVFAIEEKFKNVDVTNHKIVFQLAQNVYIANKSFIPKL